MSEHKFMYDVIGYCCMSCRWHKRSGTPEQARAEYDYAHAGVSDE